VQSNPIPQSLTSTPNTGSFQLASGRVFDPTSISPVPPVNPPSPLALALADRRAHGRPTAEPTAEPTVGPTAGPTAGATATPTLEPTATPDAHLAAPHPSCHRSRVPSRPLDQRSSDPTFTCAAWYRGAGLVGADNLFAIADSSAGIFVRLAAPVDGVEVGRSVDIVGVLAAPYGQLEVRDWRGSPSERPMRSPPIVATLAESGAAGGLAGDPRGHDRLGHPGQRAVVLTSETTRPELRVLADPPSGISRRT